MRDVPGKVRYVEAILIFVVLTHAEAAVHRQAKAGTTSSKDRSALTK